jgi:hypothetical protein
VELFCILNWSILEGRAENETDIACRSTNPAESQDGSLVGSIRGKEEKKQHRGMEGDSSVDGRNQKGGGTDEGTFLMVSSGTYLVKFDCMDGNFQWDDLLAEYSGVKSLVATSCNLYFSNIRSYVYIIFIVH